MPLEDPEEPLELLLELPEEDDELFEELEELRPGIKLCNKLGADEESEDAVTVVVLVTTMSPAAKPLIISVLVSSDKPVVT